MPFTAELLVKAKKGVEGGEGLLNGSTKLIPNA